MTTPTTQTTKTITGMRTIPIVSTNDDDGDQDDDIETWQVGAAA